ncbi:IclR family transcriptional regulator [Phaeobacter sp. J2-8]|uniref:IclR family transcriptional regulator n=1 Tax=Phaeobacter sp. J2-8 TaxID=2931394 RepID=UPI001FD5E328|nr:IclR family transcriptional regulator [Phaeobacter sp. J2-8]MCJ7873409.1 IclR family transcriptional regulator [Phaeobacter sp. J2-8]
MIEHTDVQATLCEQGTSKLGQTEASTLSTTLIRGLEVLQCFTDKDAALSNAELARRLDMNRPAVSRLCKTLLHVGYLRRDANGTFRLAPNLLTLIYPLLAAMPWRHEATDVMEEVAELTGGSMTLSIMSDDKFVQIKTVGVKDQYPHVPEIGLNGPLLRSSTGRALLSLLDEPELNAKLQYLDGLDTEVSDESRELTRKGIARCRNEGFCVSYGEWRSSIVAAATPLGKTEDGLLVAMACGMPSYRVVEDKFETSIGPRLAHVAEALRAKGLFRRD